MADQSTSRPTSPVPDEGDFWLNRATRDAVEGRETPLPAAHARHQPLRTSVRRPVPLIATLNYGLTYSVPLQVRNLSPTDAFVEMADADLAAGMWIEFVLRYHDRDEFVELRLPAQVVRADGEGVALHFVSPIARQ
jgi:hypothetical protein